MYGDNGVDVLYGNTGGDTLYGVNAGDSFRLQDDHGFDGLGRRRLVCGNR